MVREMDKRPGKKGLVHILQCCLHGRASSAVSFALNSIKRANSDVSPPSLFKTQNFIDAFAASVDLHYLSIGYFHVFFVCFYMINFNGMLFNLIII